MVNSFASQKKWFGIALTAISLSLIVSAIVWALFTVGSPQLARLRKLDRARINNLRQIQNAIDRYYKINEVLPKNLKRLELSNYISVNDPDTDEPYGYTIGFPRPLPTKATRTHTASTTNGTIQPVIMNSSSSSPKKAVIHNSN